MTMKNNLNKVVITGGAGFIGSNLAKHLFEHGTNEILVIDDLSTGAEKNLEGLEGINFVNSRVEDLNNLEELLKDYDFCFHLAAGVGVKYIMENVSKALILLILKQLIKSFQLVQVWTYQYLLPQHLKSMESLKIRFGLKNQKVY